MFNYKTSNVNITFSKINDIGDSALFSFNQSLMTGIYVAAKKNQGFGQQNADSTFVTFPIQKVVDDDFVDQGTDKKRDL